MNLTWALGDPCFGDCLFIEFEHSLMGASLHKQNDMTSSSMYIMPPLEWPRIIKIEGTRNQAEDKQN